MVRNLRSKIFILAALLLVGLNFSCSSNPIPPAASPAPSTAGPPAEAAPLVSWNEGPASSWANGPKQAFGNSTGDQQMLEYTQAGAGASLEMLVLHDDAQPDSKVGTFTQALYDEAKAKGWTLISRKNDWKHIFAFDE